MEALIPQKTKSAKTGSNRRRAKALLEKETRAIQTRNKAYRQARAAFMRQRKAVLTREAVKKAKPILDSERSKFARASLRLHGDVNAISRAKTRTQNSIDRALLRAIPGYRRYRAARNAYLKDQGRLFAQEMAGLARDDIAADLGDAVFTDDLDVQGYEPPYELFDVATLDPNNLIRSNESFVEPQNGILFNSIRFNHNESDWSLSKPARSATTSVAAGVNYEVPATGFLQGGMVIRNLYNHFAYSVTDNFGFSHAHLSIIQSIFIDIVRTGEVTSFPRTMMANGLISHGSELSHSESPIENFSPIALSFTTKDAFLKGERIQIFAGSRIHIRSDLDDMNSHVDAVLTWELLSVSVRVKA